MPDEDVPDAPAPPVLPFHVYEYATFTRVDATVLFGNVTPRAMRFKLVRPWGVLHCVDAADKRWTLLGDADYTAALRAAQAPIVLPDDYDHGPFTAEWSGKGVAGATLSEFPVAEFKPRFSVAEWPDRWDAGHVLNIFPWSIA
jgi:hypothetical protein